MTLADPAAPGGEKLPLADLNGSLLLIKVIDQLTDVPTVHGPTNPISADVHVLDGDLKGEVYADTLLFPRYLCSQLKPRIGEWVPARLGQGTPKPGQSAPWVLNALTADDKKVAQAAYAKLTAEPDLDGF